MHTFFFSTVQFANKNNEENNEGNKAQIQTRGKTRFVSVSIFKDKMTMFILLQQLDLHSNDAAAPKLQGSWRLTRHSLCSSVYPGTE